MAMTMCIKVSVFKLSSFFTQLCPFLILWPIFIGFSSIFASTTAKFDPWTQQKKKRDTFVTVFPGRFKG